MKQSIQTGPLVSVVIPIYRVEEYLKECIDSVINQTYRNLEIMLILDGSNDNCDALAENYAYFDKRVLCIHKRNEGLGISRNKGTYNASGKYIIYLDSDDYWKNDAIEKLVEIAEKDRTEVLIFGIESFPDGVIEDKWKRSVSTHRILNRKLMTGIDYYCAANDCDEYYACSVMRMINLSYLKDNSFYFHKYIHEDESFSFLSCINAERVECIDDVLYNRRFRPGSIMTQRNYLASMIGYSQCIRDIVEDYRRKNLNETEKKPYIHRTYVYFGSILKCFSKVIDSDKCIDNCIIDLVQKNLRTAIYVIPNLSIIYKITSRNMYIGYCIQKISDGIRNSRHN